MVVCAVARRTVGVDVEPRDRAGEIFEVAERVFSAFERAELYALEGAARRERAVALWTSKEAYIKARGIGISLPLREISMHFDRAFPRVEVSPAIEDGIAWAFRAFDVDGHRVAVCVDANDADVQVKVEDVVP
jgi:4'-phosphopantetheinyl transferase